MFIKKAYMNLSIKYKLLVLMYAVILILSILFGGYSYKVSVSQVSERISTANTEVVRQISNNIMFLQNDAVDLSSFFTINSSIQDVLSSSTDSRQALPQQQLENLDAMKFVLSAIITKDYLSGMVLYDSTGRPFYNDFTDGSNGIHKLSAPDAIDIMKKMDANNGKPYWFSVDMNSGKLLQQMIGNKIVMGRIVKNDETNEKIGYLLLFLNKYTIESIYRDNLHSEEESFFIMDEQGNLISHAGNKSSLELLQPVNDRYLASPGEDTLNFQDQQSGMLVSSAIITSSRWRICYTVPTKNMIDQISSIKRFTVLMILLATILTFPFIFLISTYFTSPVKKLLRSMKRFEKGDFNERVDFLYDDEIGMLGAGYNKMVENIKELIDNSYKLEIKEREAELRALQAQINPHFLYNTLNTIYWKAVKTNQTEISEMTFLLSQLFRLTLNKGKDWVTLGDEKELMYCYLSLQAIRFKNRLKFNLEIDDSLLAYTMPKLLLQPFVENSVIHGIGDRTEGGEITVTASEQDGRLHFTLMDDGLGMNSEMVDALNASDFDRFGSSLKHSGYAVRNVMERLELTYGTAYSIRFESTIGKGTTIYMSIPIEDRWK